MRVSSARRYLFVLGHMRSYSSLLCHILGSHPQINGYCETHVKYRSRFDLLRLRSRVVKLTGEPLQSDYTQFAHTGEGGFGDPSETITTGRVTNAAREPRTPVM